MQKKFYMDLEETSQRLHQTIDKMVETMTTSKADRIGCEQLQMKHINEEIQHGDFTSFDRLTDSQKGDIAKDWDNNMRMKYLNRHPVITEEEFLKELDKIAEGTSIL